jgi:hypothetical protein
MRGGSRQRLQNAKEAETDVNPTFSVLALHLLEQIMWGALSPQQGQTIAHLACQDMMAQDGTPTKDIMNLAKIGDYGAYPNNCNRDLMKLLKEPLIPEPVSVPTPVVEHSVRGYKIEDLNFIDPHAVFASFYKNNEAWESRICSSTDTLSQFWEGQVLAGSPRLDNNPMLEVESWKTKFVPIFLHGDGAPVVGVGKSWGKSMDSFSWGSCVARGSTSIISILIFSCFLALQVAGMGVPHGGTMHLVCEYSPRVSVCFLCGM